MDVVDVVGTGVTISYRRLPAGEDQSGGLSVHRWRFDGVRVVVREGVQADGGRPGNKAPATERKEGTQCE